ncbi:MAG TPA: hypothetical protein VMS22_08645 [Candidatus Eisenbacteria bacterium]|nr:hypothetical protein [Candidatus Eisenbacteria bacterium]
MPARETFRLTPSRWNSTRPIRFDAGREVVLKGLAGTHHVYPVRLA